ncbi:MAG: ATP-dependent helicase [Candidatus Omnitrophica bacterium]|nr:ATP-dependent helicase [Candidatus Omnitrophota bacterium]
MEDLRRKLNPSQYSAVTTIDGPLLVIAGAGSGKTRAIEYRVLHMVESGIAPGAILLLTFTRKAAHEMISRASRHDARCAHVDGGTFHSFAFKTLKKHAKVLGLSNTFSILDESDAAEAIHKCALRTGLVDKDRKVPKKDTLRGVISMSINKGLSIVQVLEKEYPHFLEMAKEIELLRKEYAAYKIQKNYMDYDDLLVYLRMLLNIDEARRKLSGKYKYVMVDEYQDTNILQGDIAYLLAKEHGNIMVVGDDAQSIYGFRGSSHKNIMEFPKRFDHCKIVKLEENYRSTQDILNVANSVLENMDNKYSKCLISTRADAGEKPKLNFFKNPYDEAAWIAGKIKELRDGGVEARRQAVLFRSAYVSIPLQAELARNGIQYQVFGGLKFYETAHVKDLTAHLKVVLNLKDEIAWHRMLTLVDGIGPKTADRIAAEIMSKGSLKDAAEKAMGDSGKFGKSVKNMWRLRSFLKSVSNYKLGPGALYDLALDYYLPLMKEKFDDWHMRVNDLETLRQIAARYDSLEELLADFAIEPPDRGVWKVEAAPKDEEKPVTLSTIHSSKGLEWDSVFLIGLIDGVLPSSFSLDSEEEIEEESRLFYVAITRAKNRLFLSMNHEGSRGGITQFNKVSRFIDAPNILAGLDQKALFDSVRDIDMDLDDDDGIAPVYDRSSLLREVIDNYS